MNARTLSHPFRTSRSRDSVDAACRSLDASSSCCSSEDSRTVLPLISSCILATAETYVSVAFNLSEKVVNNNTGPMHTKNDAPLVVCRRPTGTRVLQLCQVRLNNRSLHHNGHESATITAPTHTKAHGKTTGFRGRFQHNRDTGIVCSDFAGQALPLSGPHLVYRIS
jgi:hypothetical protein